ncbi:TPA: hypothetical protein NHU00_000620 [Proteus mirabilis]|nr:hypothetical protein [Proteus mirabilis]
MSILIEIQNDCINSKVQLSDLLRKCLYLAHKIKNENFIRWVNDELNGYKNTDEIPEYRILNCVVKGDFTDGYNIWKNYPIDITKFPEPVQKNYGVMRVANSVSSIEELTSHDSIMMERPWDTHIVSLISKGFTHQDVMRIWSESPAHLYTAILDGIKTRILQFTLEVESKISNIEDIKLSNLNDEQKEKIAHIFNTNIYGNANVANASENFNQNLQVQSHDLIDKLLSELLEIKKQGKDTQIIDDIIPHVESMKSVKEQTGVMTKLVEIMTIAGGSASVLSVITPYISQLKELFM